MALVLAAGRPGESEAWVCGVDAIAPEGTTCGDLKAEPEKRDNQWSWLERIRYRSLRSEFKGTLRWMQKRGVKLLKLQERKGKQDSYQLQVD